MAGKAWTEGVPVFDQTLPNGQRFAYPPISLSVFGPMSQLSLNAAHALMIVAGVVALATVVWLTMRMLHVRPTIGMVGAAAAMVGAAIWLQPVHDTLGQGQINLILMLLVVADFSRSDKRWHGALIGVATAVKLTPAIFLLYLLLIRRTRAFITGSLVAAVLTGVGFLVAPGESKRYWLEGGFTDTDWLFAPIQPGDVSNHSIRGLVTRLGADQTLIWLVLALVVVVAGLGLAVRVHQLGDPVAGMLAAAITGLLVSPLSWHEHWVWIVPIVIWSIAAAARLSARWPILSPALPIAVTFPFLLWPIAIEPGRLGAAAIIAPAGNLWREGHRDPIVLLASAGYVCAGLLMLAGGWWALSMFKGPKCSSAVTGNVADTASTG
jgi:alpha-1,2-mannosyltransferase